MAKALKAENYVFNTNNLQNIITEDDNRFSTFDEAIVSNQTNDTAMSRYVREVVNSNQISDINEPTLQRDGINNLQTNSDNAFIKNIINSSVDDEIETAIVDDDDIDDEIDDFLDDLEDSLVYEFVDDLIMNIDRNALLNFQEFSQIVISLYQDIRKDEIEQIFKMLDKSNDGFVSYTEILPLINYLQKQKSEQERGKNISRDKFTKNKVSVSIDTKFRSDYFKQSSSSFDIEIPEIQKNVTQLKLSTLDIPITHYNVSNCLQNNQLFIVSDANTIELTSDCNLDWHFKSQIGEVSANFHLGTILEDINVTASDNSTSPTGGSNLEECKGRIFSTSNTYSSLPENIIQNNFIIEQIPQNFDFSSVSIETSGIRLNTTDLSAGWTDNFTFPSRNGGTENENSSTLIGQGNYNHINFKTVTHTSSITNNYVTDISVVETDTSFYDDLTREVLVPCRPSLVTTDGNTITSETNYSFNQFATIDDNFVNDETSGGESIVNNKILSDLDTDDTQSNYDGRFINFKDKGVNNSESSFIIDNGTAKIQIDFANNFGKIKRFTQFGDISVNEIKKNVPQKIINKQLYNIDYVTVNFQGFTGYALLNGAITSTMGSGIYQFLSILGLAGVVLNSLLNALAGSLTTFHDNIYNDIGEIGPRFLPNNNTTNVVAIGNSSSTINCNAKKDVTSDSVVTNLVTQHFGYSPNYNPNRNDISKNNIKYSGSTTIEPYYDASHNTSSVTQTTHIRKLHLKSFVYINPETEEEVSSFAPVQMCWRLTLPNGNYDDAWKNISLYERVVNDSIRLATPGALDKDGIFAKIKNPEWYNFLNRDKFYKFKYYDRGDKFLNTQKKDLIFSIDRISKKCIFTRPRYKSMTILSHKFILRDGMTPLKTSFAVKNNQGIFFKNINNFGEPYPEIMNLYADAKKIHFKTIYNQENSLSEIRMNVKNSMKSSENIQTSLGWVLGFRASNYILKHHIVSEGVPFMSGPRYGYISIDDHQTNSKSEFQVVYNDSVRDDNIIARINLAPQSVHTLSLRDAGMASLLNRTRTYHGPVDIQKLTIKLYDEYGRIIDLNNTDWSFTLEFEKEVNRLVENDKS